jgi:hypothetical protein
MGSATEGVRSDRLGSADFRPTHPWDHNFFLAMVLAIWVGILAGFVPELIHFAAIGKKLPIILHIHGAVFVGWLALITTQVLLIRFRNIGLHRRLGLAAIALAALVIIVGPTTAVMMDRLEFGTPDDNTPFLFVQMTDMLSFAVLASAGFLLRNESAAHKRLMLMATLYIADAGFARWIGGALDGVIGHTAPWAYFMDLYLGNDLLMLGVGGYDLITRRRLHPAYVAALAYVAAIQIISVWVRLTPEWQPIAAHLLGH